MCLPGIRLSCPYGGQVAPSLAEYLAPDGFEQPRMWSLAKELRLGPEAGRAAVRVLTDQWGRHHTSYVDRTPPRPADPVLLVPGFLAGDYSLRLLGSTLRRQGFRTYRSQIRTNVSCLMTNAALLERRLEAIATKRGRRVRIVGHSLGGMLARGLAVRRPDLISGVVSMGSPMMAPGTSHPVLLTAAEMLVRLSAAGLPGMMSEACVRGDCALTAWEESRQPIPDDVAFSCLYSRGDGFVDWRSCIDPLAKQVEVRASHIGMAIDPAVADVVVRELWAQIAESARVDAGSRRVGSS